MPANYHKIWSGLVAVKGAVSLLLIASFLIIQVGMVKAQSPAENLMQSNIANMEDGTFQVADVAHASISLDINIPMRHIKGQVIYRLKTVSRGTDPLVFVGNDIDYTAVHKLGDNGWEPAIYAVRPDAISLKDKLYVVMEDGFHALRISYIGTDQSLNIWSPTSSIDHPASPPKPYFFSQSGIAGVEAWMPLPDANWDAMGAPQFGFDMKLQAGQNTALLASIDWPVYQSPLLGKGQSHFYQQQAIKIDSLLITAFPVVAQETHKNVLVINSNPQTDIEEFSQEARSLANAVASLDALLGVNHPWGYSILMLPPTYPDDMRFGRGYLLLPEFYSGQTNAPENWLPGVAYNRLQQYLEPASIVEQALVKGIANQLSDHLLFERDRSGQQHEFDRDRMAEAERLMLNLIPEETVLSHDYKGVDVKPDQAQFLALKALAMLEDLRQTFGTESYHLFLKSWIQQRATKKQAFTLSDFITYAQANLLDIYNGKMSPDRLTDWIRGWGMLSVSNSDQLPSGTSQDDVLSQAQKVSDFMQNFKELTAAQFPDWPADWSAREWRWALTYLDGDTSNEHLMAVHQAMVGKRDNLSPLLLRDWYQIAIGLDFTPVNPYVEQFVTQNYSRVLIVPLYQAYKDALEDDQLVIDLYQKNRDRYHSGVIRTLDSLLEWQQTPEE